MVGLSPGDISLTIDILIQKKNNARFAHLGKVLL
jgi:hypothetical protein